MDASDVRAGLARVQDGIALEHRGRVIGFLIFKRDAVEAITAAGRHLGRWNTAIAAAAALVEAV